MIKMFLVLTFVTGYGSITSETVTLELPAEHAVELCETAGNNAQLNYTGASKMAYVCIVGN